MQEFTYYNPVKMICGENKLEEVINEIKGYGDKVLLILGGNSFNANGNYEPFVKALSDANIKYYELKGNRVPSLNVVRQGIDLCTKEEINCVLGIGGGVCMDLAKTIAFGAKQPNDIWDYLTYQVMPENYDHIPVGTIPTYPSSGSDMNGSTQITNDETKEQAGLSDVYPNFTWLNPAYIENLSVESMIEGQITSFVQLSIAYIGLDRSDIAENIALSFMDSIRNNLSKLVANPGDKEARTNLMISSALNVSGITNLGKTGDWSLYPLQGIIQNYYDLGYKQSISILFPYWLKQCYNGQQVIKDYFKNVFKIECADKNDDLILKEGLNALFDFYKQFSFPTTFEEVKSKEENLDELREVINNIG